MKKKPIVKYLTDGNIAKVGMIVVILESSNGNKIGTITQILEVAARQVRYPTGSPSFVVCKAINSDNDTFNESIGFPELYYKHCPVWEEDILCIRKATPEERKLYYKQLYGQTT